MSKFTGLDPLGHYLENGIDFELHEPCEFFLSKKEGVGKSIIAPAGFITDFASIPEFIQPVIPQYKGRRAAIIHDLLYRTKGLSGEFTRKECDQVFYDALDVLKVDRVTKIFLYLGVRIGGWLTWNRYKNPVYGNV
jgi:Protein of unknown function (DUF1353)